MRAFVDLHCHTKASFDSLSRPRDVARAAAERGLTHLAITDHDRLDGALEAREHAPAGLTILVGEEIKTTSGDLIGLFLEEAVPPGLSPSEAIAAVRQQGGLVGIPHPFDRFRNSLARGEELDALVGLVDWVEVHNSRLVGRGNEQATLFAIRHGLPGVAVSDAHSVLEVAVSYSVLEGDPSTPAGLLAALPPASLVTSRASYLVRLVTPVAKAVQRVRGNGRIRAAGTQAQPEDMPAQPEETQAQSEDTPAQTEDSPARPEDTPARPGDPPPGPAAPASGERAAIDEPDASP
jgi:predicted metal-dependent phosphoesterase TrpH